MFVHILRNNNNDNIYILCSALRMSYLYNVIILYYWWLHGDLSRSNRLGGDSDAGKKQSRVTGFDSTCKRLCR